MRKLHGSVVVKGFVALALLGVSIVGFAQKPEESSSSPRSGFQANGQFFSIRVVPKEKHLQIYVAGREAADVTPDGLTLKAFLVTPQKEIALPVAKNMGFFTVPLKKKGELRLNLKAGKKTETMNVPALP